MAAGWLCFEHRLLVRLAAGSSFDASCSSVPSGSSGEATVSQRYEPWLKSVFFTNPSTSV